MPADPSLARTFSIHPYAIQAGGESRFNPSIYAGPFQQQLEAEELGYKRAAEERKSRYEELATRAQERKDRWQERQMQRDEDVDAALELLDKKLGNPSSMHFQEHYEDVMGDPLVHRAMAHREGRAAVMAIMKEKHDAHENYMDGWSKIASNYGYNGNLRTLPLNAKGEVDWEKTKPIFDSALLQKQQDDAMKRQIAMKRAAAMHLVPTAADPETGYATKFGLPKETYDLGADNSKPAAEDESTSPTPQPSPKVKPTKDINQINFGM
jgi:hypothetical protein